MFDGNSPFELYKKTDKQHFDLRTGEVDVKKEMPPGIGVRKMVEGKGEIIVDPMTDEIICTKEVEEGGKKVMKPGDSWFVMNFKLKWKDTTGAVEGGGAPEAGPRGNQPGAKQPSSPAQPKPSGGGAKPAAED